MRPKTLVASFIPVSTGASIAYAASGKLDLWLWLLCLLFAILIQSGTNLANDYFDFKRGADEDRKNAPVRFAAAGKLAPTAIRNASYLILLLAFLIGLLLLRQCGGSIHLLWVGIASVFCAIAYTGGPFPLAYNGLGDVFVIFFYGFVAVESTVYVLSSGSGQVYEPSLYLSFATGCAINTLLLVNNYRDHDQDKKNNKNTTIVLFGKKFGVILYALSVGVSTLILPLVEDRLRFCMACLPVALYNAYGLTKAREKADFDHLLSSTAVQILAFGILSSLGVIYY